MRSILKLSLFTLIISITAACFGYGQEQRVRDDIENVLKQFKNWRFGTVSLYEIKNLNEIRRAIESKEEKKTVSIQGEECVRNANPDIKSKIEAGAQAGDDLDKIIEDMMGQGLLLPPRTELECIYNFFKKGTGPVERIEHAYIITTRPLRNEVPSTIIGLIVSLSTSDNLKRNLRNVSFNSIYSYRELKEEKLDTSFKSKNLYDLMMNYLIQGNVDNRTLDAQGIGTDFFAPKVHGITSSLFLNESDLTNSELQTVMRISEGQPTDYFIRNNELIISPDLISWRLYESPYLIDENYNFIIDTLTGKYKIDSNFITNLTPPVFGLELKYGIDEINYPSLWSERLTLNAIWKNVKFGIIMPAGSYFGSSTSIFEQERKLTNGGFGISGSMDFDVKIIPQSGVFHFGFGYVFGDAREAPYKPKPDPDNFIDTRNDFLVRADAQLLYTFGVQIDRDYMLRFGLLGTVYNIERWYYDLQQDPDEGTNYLVYKKLKDETIGGISGKIDFMAINISTPFGASVSYFDEALGAGAWLQIPVPLFDNSMALRLDAKGFFPIFRNKNHDWETNSLFIPMVRIIYNF